MHSAHYLRNAIILGLLTAMGPFAVDMYLPALPTIGDTFGAGGDTVMLSLTSYFVAFGLFQILFGSLADVYGRKMPLYAGMTLFVLAGIGCAMATSIEMLIALRFLQGIGGAAGIIVPRAIVRDMYSGVEEVKMMSMLMLVFSVSPLLAPLAGSFLIQDFGWRSIFWVITVFGILGIGMLGVFVRETLPPERRIKSDLKAMGQAWRTLFADRAFMGMTFIGAFAMTAFFIYLGNSAFVLSDHYGLSPRQYSLAFSANALAFFAAAQLNGYLGGKYGMQKLLVPAAAGFATVITTLAVLFALGFNGFWVMAGMLFIGFSFVGILLPTIMVLALENHGDMAGTAASLMNTVQLMIGALAIGLSGIIVNGSPMNMVACIAACAVATLATTVWTFQKK